MTNRVLVRDLHSFVNQSVLVKGWVQTIRDQKNMQFIHVRDHTGLIQCIVERKKENNKLNETISTTTRESAISVRGLLITNKQSQTQGFEIQIENVFVENKAEEQTPISVSGYDESSLDKRLDWRYLDLRSLKKYLIFKIQTEMEMAMREFWTKDGFIEIHSPKLMGSASESGSELFAVEYFGRKAYLAQSPQFYKQMAMAAGFDRIFEIGPVFRANPSFTSRHDTEFTSIDVEISWINSHEDVMSLEEKWIQYFLKKLKEYLEPQIYKYFGKHVAVPEIPFPRITLAEAIEEVEKQGHKAAVKGDLDPEGERIIHRKIKKEFGHEFVFITDYPTEVRPFYHMRYENAPKLTKSFDLLWAGIEITTGAQREHRYEILREQAKEKGLNTERIQFYLDFFRYGCPPHGGYGFGLTRALVLLLGLTNVREVTFLPRDPKRLNP